MESDACKTAEKYQKLVVWDANTVDMLSEIYGFEKADVVVMDNLPCETYEKILRSMRRSNRPMEILNMRKHYPPHPPVLWCVAKTLEQVVNLKPDFDGQVVLVVAHPDIDPSLYVDIAFHAELRGFLLLNTGPWSVKKSHVVGWNKGIFKSMLGRVYNQLNNEIELKQKEEASFEQWKGSLDRDEAVLGFFAEEYGSSSAYAEAESITDALIESKQKQLSQLEANLVHVETLMKILPGELSGLLTLLENQVNYKISEIMEVRTRRVLLEAALEQLENQLNAESRSCSPPSGVASEVFLDLHNIKVCRLREKSRSYKGLSKIFRGKTLKKRPWSLLGISASLGLSVLAYSYFRQGVGEPHSYEHVE